MGRHFSCISIVFDRSSYSSTRRSMGCSRQHWNLHHRCPQHFTHYHQLSATDTDAAFTARLDDRAIQNSKAMYRTLKASITGTLSSSIFGQFGNAPINEDGVGLWIKLTKFTLTSSLQMSVTAFEQIIHFRPEDHDFHAPTINSKLLNLFVLATTRHRELGDPEKLQHTITVYSRIKQPPLCASSPLSQ